MLGGNEIGAVAGVLAAGIQVLGYGLYAADVLRGHIRPNATSWGLWAAGNILVVALYVRVATDWAVLALPTVCALASVATFALAMRRGSVEPLGRTDVGVVLLDLVVVGIWLASGDQRLAYSALLFDIVLTFVPIWLSTARNPGAERPGPWIVWTAAYLLMLVAALLREPTWTALALPALYACVHLAVAALALRKAGKPALGSID